MANPHTPPNMEHSQSTKIYHNGNTSILGGSGGLSTRGRGSGFLVLPYAGLRPAAKVLGLRGFRVWGVIS